MTLMGSSPGVAQERRAVPARNPLGAHHCNPLAPRGPLRRGSPIGWPTSDLSGLTAELYKSRVSAATSSILRSPPLHPALVSSSLRRPPSRIASTPVYRGGFLSRWPSLLDLGFFSVVFFWVGFLCHSS